MAIIHKATPRVQSLNKHWYDGAVERIDMLRLDEIHPVISGNKWYKLKYNIEQILLNGYKGVLTFGGGYSNHLIATAAAAKEYNIDAVGIVRGQELARNLSPTLLHCKELGMELVFISRKQYAEKTSEHYLNTLQNQYPDLYIVAEGGANDWGRIGAGEIGQMVSNDYTHICVSVGTGTTMAGICNETECTVIGYAPMKGGQYLKETLKEWGAKGDFEVHDQWHFGGFGKHQPELISFINDFYKINQIPLDIVYTGKMMFGVRAQISAGIFSNSAKVLCIHTGGLQGNISVAEQLDF